MKKIRLIMLLVLVAFTHTSCLTMALPSIVWEIEDAINNSMKGAEEC